MSLQTPESIRRLQHKLYRKAKAEPGYRFYLLYDKIYREDILRYAYQLARANQGAPGVDGQTFEEIETKGLEEWILGLQQELRAKTYQPQPVRRVMIPKPGGGLRPLGIPTIRDRVAQTAAKLVLEPIFREYISCSGRATLRWWTLICLSTSTPFRTGSCCNVWRGESSIGTCSGW
jgi:RNA-directed DNA polymerase